MRRLLLPPHDRERAQHILGLVPRQSIQMKEHRVQPRAGALCPLWLTCHTPTAGCQPPWPEPTLPCYQPTMDPTPIRATLIQFADAVRRDRRANAGTAHDGTALELLIAPRFHGLLESICTIRFPAAPQILPNTAIPALAALTSPSNAPASPPAPSSNSSSPILRSIRAAFAATTPISSSVSRNSRSGASPTSTPSISISMANSAIRPSSFPPPPWTPRPRIKPRTA